MSRLSCRMRESLSKPIFRPWRGDLSLVRWHRPMKNRETVRQLNKLRDTSVWRHYYRLDSRYLEAARGGAGAFDARTIAHQVIVPFDQANDRVLGGSQEPYVNNPLRIPAVTSHRRKSQKDKAGWDNLCRVLDHVAIANDPVITAAVFKQILATISRRLAQVKVTYPAPRRISLEAALQLIGAFTEERSGGDRFEAITTALFQAIGRRFGLFASIRRSNVTTADQSSGMLMDLECLDSNGEIVLVVEAKDRTLTLSQVASKIAGIREHRIGEAFFVANSINPDDISSLRELLRKEFIGGQNIYIADLGSFAQSILALLGEEGRSLFVEFVGAQLNEHSEVRHRKEWARLLGAI